MPLFLTPEARDLQAKFRLNLSKIFFDLKNEMDLTEEFDLFVRAENVPGVWARIGEVQNSKKKTLVMVLNSGPGAGWTRENLAISFVHELVHLKQNLKNELTFCGEKILWMNREINLDKIPYCALPYEVEAHSYSERHFHKYLKKEFSLS